MKLAARCDALGIDGALAFTTTDPIHRVVLKARVEAGERLRAQHDLEVAELTALSVTQLLAGG